MPFHRTRALRRLAGVTLLTLALAGCAATTRQLDTDGATNYDDTYGFSDKKEIVDVLTESLAASRPIASAPAAPVAIIYGVANRTSEHIDTSGITDDIRNALLKSGDVRFVNRPQRDNLTLEADYQYAGFVAPEQRVAEGRQVGADYTVSGTLRSIQKRQPSQWRLNKKRYTYYSMTLELTDLETGELVWADSVELARELSQPILRW